MCFPMRTVFHRRSPGRGSVPFRPRRPALEIAAEVADPVGEYPIPDFTGDPADDLSFDLVGETYLHRCRILAAGRAGARLEIHLLAAAIDRVNLAAPLRAPAVGGPLQAPPVEVGSGSESPEISLRQRFVFTFADADEAISEETVIDHWGEHGILVEGHVSGLRQGVVLYDPVTRISTGVRLPLGD
jgi:hypothetical protein